jgi:fumarate hydratase subunit alpha
VDGLKTGWIRSSRHNLITTARSGDVRLISVMLGAPTSTDLTEGSAMLIDAGFITVESGGRIKVREQFEAPPGTFARRNAASRDLLEITDTAAAIETDENGMETDTVRNIGAGDITEAVARLCARSNHHLSDSAIELLLSPDDSGKDSLEEAPDSPPMCARPRTTMVLAEVGQDIHVTGGSLSEALRDGVRRGSWNHEDTMPWPVSDDWGTDDLPCVIHYDIVPGGRLRINVLPIGFEGEERFDTASSPRDLGDMKDFITRTAENALSGLCPPVTVGVGVGKTMEESASMARRALTRGVNEYNDDENWARLESDLIWTINDLAGDLPGFGDFDAVLAVNIEASREDISNPVVVIYIRCHATSGAEIIL